jgi:hypothetical protein
MVFMKEKGEWMIDGLAIASRDNILLAQGNLYGFPASKDQGEVWEKFSFLDEWNDSRQTGNDSFNVKKFVTPEKNNSSN